MSPVRTGVPTARSSDPGDEPRGSAGGRAAGIPADRYSRWPGRGRRPEPGLRRGFQVVFTTPSVW